MTLTAVVTSHESERFLRSILGQLRYQSRRPNEILVYISGEGYDTMRLREDFPEAAFHVTEDFRDWGHSKRAIGLESASSEYVGFFNDDDLYSPDYIHKMMSKLEENPGYGVVFCNWSYAPEDCGFHLGSSTAGNFFVHVEAARDVGGWKSREYTADGHFINRLNERGHRQLKVDENLYTHNAYERETV